MEINSLVQELYGNVFTGVNKADNEWVTIAREIHKAKEYRRRYEEIEKKLMAQLVDLSEHKETYAGGFKLERVKRSGSVDYKLIPELRNIDTTMYRKEDTFYWKLSTALTEAIDTLNVL